MGIGQHKDKTTILLVIFTKKALTSLRTLLEAKGFIRIPLKKLSTGHYQLSLSVNKKFGHFILDSGASSSCICLDYAKYFHLRLEETEIKASGAGANNMETKISRGNYLSFGTIDVKKTDFVLFNMVHVNEALSQAGEANVHGILGADLMKRLHAILDYGRNCVYLKK